MHARNTSNHGGEDIPAPSSQFDDIASFYDQLMLGVPYRQWVDYIQSILKRHNRRPSTVLDLCCGTGTVSRLMARGGYEVTGVDISPGMIEAAKEKAQKERLQIDFSVQDACKLRLGRRFDLIVSLFDSLNYILESSQLQQAFYRAAEHLPPEGLFVFDMNTEYAFATGLFTQDNLRLKSAPVHYNWRGSYDPFARICRVFMEFTYKVGGEERRSEVRHFQRAYDMEEVADMLRSADLKVEAVYDAYSFDQPTMKSDRLFYVASHN